MNHTHSLIENKAIIFARAAWYWLFGGVIECGKVAYDFRHIVASEFTVESFLLVAGVWLMLPGGYTLPLAFVQTIERVMPTWVFGIIYFAVARIAIHGTLKCNFRVRELMKLIITFCWGVMLALNIMAGALDFGTALMLYMTILSGSLAWRLIKKNTADALQAENE